MRLHCLLAHCVSHLEVKKPCPPRGANLTLFEQVFIGRLPCSIYCAGPWRCWDKMWSGPQEFTREMTNVETVKKTSRQHGVSGTWTVSAVTESFLSSVPGAELEGGRVGDCGYSSSRPCLAQCLLHKRCSEDLCEWLAITESLEKSFMKQVPWVLSFEDRVRFWTGKRDGNGWTKCSIYVPWNIIQPFKGKTFWPMLQHGCNLRTPYQSQKDKHRRIPLI